MSSLSRNRHKAQLQQKFPNHQFQYRRGTRGRAKYASDQLIACVSGPNDSEAERDWKTLKLLRGKLAAPEVVEVFDAYGERYFVYCLIPGESAGKLLETADETKSYEIGKLMGTQLNELQSIDVQAFGHLMLHPSFRALLIKHAPGVSEDNIPSDPGKQVLVHNDYLPHNLLLNEEGTSITGIVDFEWSFIGDPRWDVGYLKYWLHSDHEKYKDYKHPLKVWEGFLKGYGQEIDCKSAGFFATLRKTNGAPAPPISWGN